LSEFMVTQCDNAIDEEMVENWNIFFLIPFHIQCYWRNDCWNLYYIVPSSWPVSVNHRSF